MIEIFKTSVNHPDEAGMLMARTIETFDSYIANFDLEDFKARMA